MQYNLTKKEKSKILMGSFGEIDYPLQQGKSISLNYDSFNVIIKDCNTKHVIDVFAKSCFDYIKYACNAFKTITKNTEFRWINEINAEYFETYCFDEIIIVGDKKEIDNYYIIFLDIFKQLKNY